MSYMTKDQLGKLLTRLFFLVLFFPTYYHGRELSQRLTVKQQERAQPK